MKEVERISLYYHRIPNGQSLKGTGSPGENLNLIQASGCAKIIGAHDRHLSTRSRWALLSMFLQLLVRAPNTDSNGQWFCLLRCV
jgi:hypothetical protein